MIDEVKAVSKSRLIDRVRFGERYLRYNLEDIEHTKSFSTLKDIKTTLKKRQSLQQETMDSGESPYENLSVPMDTSHDIDKLI